MHLIVRDGASLDEIGEPQDLGLAPADFILLSFSDSDLAAFRAATKSIGEESPLTRPLCGHPLPQGERVMCPVERAHTLSAGTPGLPPPAKSACGFGSFRRQARQGELAGEGWG